jgi:hypothetical protein
MEDEVEVSLAFAKMGYVFRKAAVLTVNPSTNHLKDSWVINISTSSEEEEACYH